MMSRRATVTTIFAPAVGQRDAGQPGDLRILDLERRRLADLPANQLIEILRLCRDLFEAQQRELADGVGQHERDAVRPGRQLVEHACGSPRSAPPRS